MSLALGRRLRLALAPVLGLALLGYFSWHAVQGERGWLSMQVRTAQIEEARAELARASAARLAAERRVAALRSNRIDPDTLDERARAMLNLVGRDDLVVLYGPGGRLY